MATISIKNVTAREAAVEWIRSYAQWFRLGQDASPAERYRCRERYQAAKAVLTGILANHPDHTHSDVTGVYYLMTDPMTGKAFPSWRRK